MWYHRGWNPPGPAHGRCRVLLEEPRKQMQRPSRGEILLFWQGSKVPLSGAFHSSNLESGTRDAYTSAVKLVFCAVGETPSWVVVVVCRRRGQQELQVGPRLGVTSKRVPASCWKALIEPSWRGMRSSLHCVLGYLKIKDKEHSFLPTFFAYKFSIERYSITFFSQ